MCTGWKERVKTSDKIVSQVMLRMSGLSVRVLKEMMYQEIIFIALSLLAAHGQEGTKKKKKKRRVSVWVETNTGLKQRGSFDSYTSYQGDGWSQWVEFGGDQE